MGPKVVNFGLDRYQLVPDLTNFSQKIGDALRSREQEKKLLAAQQLQENQTLLQNAAIGFLDTGKNGEDFVTTRQQILKQIKPLIESGVSVEKFNPILEATNLDELNNSILGFAQRMRSAGDTAEALKNKLSPSGLTPETNIGKARVDLANGLISQEQYDRFVAGELAEKESKKPTASTDIGKINQDFNNGLITFEQRQSLLGASLKQTADELSGKELLDAKDLVGVNDKVTTILKPTQEIVSAAQALEGLKGRGTPASQLAAVFKFMKANDPTSTVRESEQGQVYSAEGAMKGFAAQINQFLGEGGLTESNFADLVDTAKTIANSAVGSSQTQIKGFLNVISDNLTPKQLQNLQSRVPGMLDIEQNDLSNLSDEELLEMAQ
jgi:hypothetical protein